MDAAITKYITNECDTQTNKQTEPCSYIYTTHIGPKKKKLENELNMHPIRFSLEKNWNVVWN